MANKPVQSAPGLMPTMNCALRRRNLLLSLVTPLLLPWRGGAAAQRPENLKPIEFPRDHGAHPESAIEWWYVTGFLSDQAKWGSASSTPSFGFQVTFFRARVPSTQSMQSAFAPKQLLFAHAAITDLAGQRLLHDQRIARLAGKAEVDLGRFSIEDTLLQLGDWSLSRQAPSYQARVATAQFELDLQLEPTQAVLLQGDQGWSRKSQDPSHASQYYSLPQLKAQASLHTKRGKQQLQGLAWLDHEWSNALLAPDAVGWDWIGMNLSDGAALTAFQLRDRNGKAVWAGGSFRSAQGALSVFRAHEVQFQPARWWKSPHSGARYPVAWSLRLSAAGLSPKYHELQVATLLDDQELDSRRSTGTIYWEGLCQLLNSEQQAIGLGYLEMTGYASALRLP